MEPLLFICYPKCSTCHKAQKWLEDHRLPYHFRDIATENPTVDELTRWHAMSGLPLRRFFNTSGMKYRELNVKSQLDSGMSEEDAIRLLSTDGMLVKRPLVIGSDFVLVGFKQPEWEEKLG